MADEISAEFEKLLNECNGEENFHGLTIRQSYEGYLPWFEAYRTGDKSLDDNLKGMIENGLTEEEAFFILAYTGSASSWVNSELRDGHLPSTKCKEVFVNKLNQALAKVSSFNGNIAFRMDEPHSNSEEVLKWFHSKIGSKFKVPYFLSTAKEDYNNSSIVWQINTLTEGSFGKDISQLTNNKYEKEVLFRTGSCFEIIKVDEKKNYIHLNEVINSEQIEFDLVGDYVASN